MNKPLGVSTSKGKQGTSLKSSPTFSVRPCSSVGRVTVDLIRGSWVRFPPRSKDFFFASCGSLFPFTRANEEEEVKPWSQGWLIAAGAYPGFCSMKRLEVFLLPLDGMLVHRRSLPRNFARFPQQFAGTHLYTWVERGTVRVKCLAQEHNTMSPARARTRTARSGVERTNHEATAPPTRANAQ